MRQLHVHITANTFQGKYQESSENLEKRVPKIYFVFYDTMKVNLSIQKDSGTSNLLVFCYIFVI